jgi:hypothetical protein
LTENVEVVERERRQLRLMQDRLDRFQAGDLSIGPVINDLEALLYQLELAAEPWRDDFIEAWSDLEIPYAVALDRQTPIPTAVDTTVSEGVERLLALVRSRLEELGPGVGADE